jgi:hypothetical protein
MDLLDSLTQRPVFIALAVTGAVLATAGNIISQRASDNYKRIGRFVLRLGYGLAWCSVALFIIAGFLA